MKYIPPVNGDTSNANRSWPNADPANGIEGAIPDGRAIEHPLRELIALIHGSGYTPSENDLQQVAKAVRSQKLNVAAATGTSNAYTVTLSPTPADLDELINVPVCLIPSTVNTGPATININGLGAVPIVLNGSGAALGGGELPAFAEIRYDGEAFRLVNPNQSSASGLSSYLTSGTFVVPNGITLIKRVRVWGGGGGGGGSTGASGAGSGGCGGGYAEKVNIPVTPGASIPVVVGQGSASSSVAGQQSSDAGSSSFGSFISATGGQGGHWGNGAPAVTSGDGGEGTGGDMNLPGTPGGFGYLIGDQPAGGIGGAAPFGGSSPSLNIRSNGNFGNFPGGGGNGGSYGYLGGAGASGLVTVEY